MGKVLGGTGVFLGTLVGAIIWFVLQIIIGVIAWVSVVAGGVVALVGVLVSLGVLGARMATKHDRRRNPPLGAH